MTRPVNGAPKAKVANGVIPKPKPDVEVGVSAFLPIVTPYQNLWEALRDDDLTVKQLQAMRKTDGQARALYRLITLPIRAALKTATFLPEDNVEGGEEEAQFIEDMFTLPANAGGMEVSFQRFIAQMLLAVFDGFSAFELIYTSPSVGPLKGKWTLKEAACRPPETLTFLLDNKSRFAGFRQQCMYLGRQIDEVLPAEHCIWYAANEEERPFYGRSYFEAAWYHWDKKVKLYVIAHIAAQRAAVGTRIGKLPPNPTREERDAFKKALSDLSVAQYMTMPDNFTVDSLREAGTWDYLSYINHHNSQMSKSVLASFFDKEQGGGDSAKLVDFGQQSDSLFLLMLQTIMGEIEEVVNQRIIPRFIDWNFDSGKYPRFRFGSLSQEQKSAMLDLFKTLSVAGQTLTVRPEFLHELEVQIAEEFGLELDWESIEEEMAQEKLLMQEQQALQMEQDQLDAQASAQAGPGQPGAGGSPQVDPSLLPKGFTLSNPDDAYIALSDLAADLLDDAYNRVELVRGKARQGFKRVQTPEGARVYGEPIGSQITRDAEQIAAQGVKGKAQGQTGGRGNKSTGRQVLGGGLGDRAENRGSVRDGSKVGTASAVKRTFSHPDLPGAQLLDYGDGTVAIRDAKGNISARQRFDVAAFLKLGWKIDGAFAHQVEEEEKNAAEAKARTDNKPEPKKK